MKNMGLRFTVIGIALVLLFGFVTGNKGNNQKSTGKEQVTYKVGILQFVSHPALDEIKEGVLVGLKNEGLIENKNLEVFFQNGQADQSKLATMSQQLVNQKSQVLIGIATPAAQALANETKDIPVILGAVTDPVGAGLVKDMEEPGGNITGVSDKAPVFEQIQLATELLPNAKSMGILYSSAEDNSKYQVAEAKEAAKRLGLEAKEYAVPSTNNISQIVQVMGQTVDFIYIPLDNTIANAMPSVVNEANKLNLPIIPAVDTMVTEGGLATISINQFDIGVKIGEMTAKIVKGEAQTQSTPIYTFKEGDYIINLAQAEKLGVQIPEAIKAKAKNVGGEEK